MEKNVLTYDGLKKYDELIKEFITRPRNRYKASEERLYLHGVKSE